ncbi:MAG: pyridoxal phosphate-dependent aminotransferase [Ardenticatenales bacterium]|nr:pyridoxal phosphate-dependent aminotransferase [Ardenticatenales bacterium]
MQFAERMSRLGTETAFEVLVRARALEAQGRSIVHLEIGEPDFDTPSNITEAAIEALRKGETHYTPSAGIPQVREAIAQHISQSRDIEVGPQNVILTPGAKPIMFFAILALVDPGDEVIYPNPGFPIYESMINFVGGKAVPLPLRMEREFRFDHDELRALVNDKTRMIIINSPQNPTGGILEEEDLRLVAELAQKHDCIVLSDEIYERLVYDKPHHSITTIPGMLERTIILDGFSKTYAMTGWRLGYGVMPEELAQRMAKLATNNHSCVASFEQYAAIEALTGPQDEVETMRQEFEARRNMIVEGLNQIPGFRCVMPGGAFYAFPNIEETGKASEWLADYLLHEAGVACLKGEAFGEHGRGFIRFSYANSRKNIQEALERIDTAIRKL